MGLSKCLSTLRVDVKSQVQKKNKQLSRNPNRLAVSNVLINMYGTARVAVGMANAKLFALCTALKTSLL